MSAVSQVVTSLQSPGLYSSTMKLGFRSVLFSCLYTTLSLKAAALKWREEKKKKGIRKQKVLHSTLKMNRCHLPSEVLIPFSSIKCWNQVFLVLNCSLPSVWCPAAICSHPLFSTLFYTMYRSKVMPKSLARTEISQIRGITFFILMTDTLHAVEQLQW